jgi:hypothetical protein
MNPFATVAHALRQDGVHFVVTGVFGANYFAGGTLFMTQDQDLFLPLDAANLLRAWRCCERLGLEMDANGEPLDQPRDLQLASAIVRNSALTTARDGQLLCIDLSLVMTGLTFDEVWQRRRVFQQPGGDIHVASLKDIVAAKVAANRPKDRMFLATHAAEIKHLLERQP